MNTVQLIERYCRCGRALKCEGDHYCDHCLAMVQDEVDSDYCDGCGEAFLPRDESMDHLCGKCQVMENPDTTAQEASKRQLVQPVKPVHWMGSCPSCGEVKRVYSCLDGRHVACHSCRTDVPF
ncbi:MAG: hypothetical protein GY821_01870 [Gammaproteobacteria bacterium]|nr:hypothetical protein [Gammaproteobacteria bacterium]